MDKGKAAIYRRMAIRSKSKVAQDHQRFNGHFIDPRFDVIGTSGNVKSSDPVQRAITQAVLEGAA